MVSKLSVRQAILSVALMLLVRRWLSIVGAGLVRRMMVVVMGKLGARQRPSGGAHITIGEATAQLESVVS